jgi:hypothetical protein
MLGAFNKETPAMEECQAQLHALVRNEFNNVALQRC